MKGHMKDFEGKTFLVTGASSGIGLATAQRLVEAKARVVVVARNRERLDSVYASLAGQVLTYSCDVADEAAVKGLAEWMKAQAIMLDGLVHAAGIHALRPIKLVGAADLTSMYTSHVGSTVALVRYLGSARLFPATGSSLVVISSVAALRGGAGTVAYAAAKAGMLSVVKVAAAELAAKKIRVNAISPGVVRTPQSEAFLATLSDDQRLALEKEHPLGLGQPEDVAATACFLLSDDARWITGTNVIVDGGLTLQ